MNTRTRFAHSPTAPLARRLFALVAAGALFLGCANAPPLADGGDAAPTGDAKGVDATSPPPDLALTPSTALGANLTDGGVQFSVWAPHATSVSVEGDFAEAKVAMTLGASGIFTAQVAGAHAGTNYHYVLASPTGELTRIDPYCRQLQGAECVVVDPSRFAWQAPPFSRPPRSATIVYELHVGSFAVAGGAAQGTLASARGRLAELADLGVNVVELMPVQSFGGKPNGWGYNPQLYLAPKPSYGSPDDLRTFVDAAHGVGIGVWLDIVANHCDGWHEAPLYCFDGDCPAGSSGIYFFGTGAYAKTPWGPRPDYTSPHVASMLLASVDAWLLDYRGDGFRWDSTANIRAIDGQGITPGGRELLVAANARTHALGAFAVAEDLKGWDAITQPDNQGGFGFDAQWDGFGYGVTGVLTPPSDDARDLGAIKGALTGAYAGDPFARLLFIEDHDTVGNGGARLPSRIDPKNPESFAARKRSMLGGVLLLTAPGVPMLFMGEEALATGGFLDPPLPLAPPTAAGIKFRVFYKNMIRLRRNLDGGAGGLLDGSIEVSHQNESAKVIGYRRYGQSKEDVVVVLNLRNKAFIEYDVGVPDKGPWRVRMNTESSAYGSDYADGQSGTIAAFAAPKDGKPWTLPLKLAAYSAMVLSH